MKARFRRSLGLLVIAGWMACGAQAPSGSSPQSRPVENAPLRSGIENADARATSVENSSEVEPPQPAPSLLETQAGSPSSVLRRSPVGGLVNAKPWNYGVLVQGGFGLNDRSNFGFLNAGVRAGKVLTGEIGSGALRGNFEYGVAVLPFWQSYAPRFQRLKCATATTCSAPYAAGGTFTGISIEPIQLRWNFTHGQHWMPWVQGAGGVVWTNHKYPAIGNLNPQDFASNGPGGDTSVWNFTPQFGVGAHYFVRPKRSFDVSANAVHLSSASLGDKNPGVNTSVHFSVGYSWWK